MMLPVTFIPTHAQTQSSADTRVNVPVPATVAVLPIQPVWDLSPVATGSFSAILTWRVEANVDTILMMIEASDLYKADDPTNTEIAPIPVDESRPVAITAEHANQINGGSNNAAWVSLGETISGFPTRRTEIVTFESSQVELFTQLVSTQIFYNQRENVKPMGEYSGRVKITTMISPTTALGY
jgi:hypothetical protein